MASDQVEVRRSTRRRRTVSAYRDGDRVVVLIPNRFSRSEEREWVDRMMERLAAKEGRRRRSDEDLLRRARQLAHRYLPDHPGAQDVASVAWSTSQNSRWGSCTPVDRSVRLSARLRPMPDWVVDYVLLHELTHLVAPQHDATFWALLARYEKADRARGFLEGVSAAPSLSRVGNA